MTTPSREQGPPDATTIVIRGGVMKPADVRRNALVTARQYGFYGVSVFAAVSMAVEELLSGPVYIPHAQIRTSTVGRLRSAGYQLRRTLTLPYHYDIVLDDVADDTIAGVLACFDEPIANPRPRRPPG